MSGAWRYTSGADCARHWRWYPRVGRPETVSAIQACTRAASLALPLALAAAVPPWGYGGAPYDLPQPAPYVASGPAYAPGALFMPGAYEMPLRDGLLPSLAVAPAGGMPADVATTIAAPAGEGPALYPHTPGLTEIQPATEIPEAGSLLVLAGALVAWMLVRVGE